MKQYALVTGASSGIGLRYARVLARDYHYNLFLVSNQEKELRQVADELIAQYGVDVHTLCINLAQQQAAEQVYGYSRQHDLTVEVLVNNAGILVFNLFCETDMAKIETITMLHVVTMTKLCRLFAADMVARQSGYILNMSSMSAWMAMPSIQCYNATKGYVLGFTKSLWYELRHCNVRVLAVTPGSTDTGLLPFGPVFARILRGVGITMSPDRLVDRVLYVLFHSRRKTCMPGAWNYIIVPIINHLPDWLVFAVMRRLPMFKSAFRQGC